VAQGLIGETDNIEITATEPLMRWIHKFNADCRADGSFKKLKPGAFPLSPSDSEGFSLFIERLTTFEDCKRKAIENNALNVGIVRMTAKDFRDYDLDVEQKTENDDISHCEVTKYQMKTADELTDIKRQWILRTKELYTAFAN